MSIEYSITVDRSLQIKDCCSAFRNVLGLESETLLGKHLNEILDNKCCSMLSEWWEKETGPVLLGKLTPVAGHAESWPQDLKWRIVPLADSNSPPIIAVITAVKDGSELSAPSERILKSVIDLFEDIGLATGVVDPQGKLLLFNQGFSAISRYSEDEVINSPSVYEMFVNRRDFRKAFKECTKTSVVKQFYADLICRQGETKEVSVDFKTFSPIEDSDIVVLMFVTERVSSFVEANNEAGYLCQQLEDFSAIVARSIAIDNSSELYRQFADAITEISHFSKAVIVVFKGELHNSDLITTSGLTIEEIEKVNQEILSEDLLRKICQREDKKISAGSYYLKARELTVRNNEDQISDLEEHDGRESDLDEYRMIMPFWHGDRVLGYIMSYNNTSGTRPTSRSVKPFELFAFQMLQVLARNLLENEVKTKQKDLQLLYDLSIWINSSLDADEVLRKLAQAILTQMNYSHVAIYMLEGGVLVRKTFAGEAPVKGYERIKVGKGVVGQSFFKGEPILVNDVTTFEPYLPTVLDTQSEVAVPIKSVAIVEGEETESVIGVLNCESSALDFFTVEDMHRLEAIANTASMAIENSRLMERVLSLLQAEANYSQELERKKAELDEFVHIISHDLKSPLNSIAGFTDMLQYDLRDNENTKVNQYVERINVNVQVVSRMLKDLLELSRVGRVEDEKQHVNIVTLIKEIQFDLEALGYDAGPEIECIDLPEVVYASLRRLSQLLTNLITNALKYSDPDRKLKISISCEDLGMEYEFAVSDNGIGMEKYQLNTIFVFGVRLKEKEVEGTGAGLAIAKKIVESYGGRIWVESKKGVGSTFFFTIPKYHQST